MPNITAPGGGSSAFGMENYMEPGPAGFGESLTAQQAQHESGRDPAKRPETPQWKRRWPHDQPNGWNLDADKFLAMIKATDGMMWLALGKAKYIELRVDTRDCGFNLYDRDGLPLNPDEVVAAVEHVKKNYSAGTKQPDDLAQAVRSPSEPLRCLRCGTIDAFGPVSKKDTTNG